MDADGQNPVRRTTTSGGDYSPVWSPDGTKLVFSRSGNLYVMNADGSGAAQLTFQSFDDDPAWSPDGRWIAYTVASSDDYYCDYSVQLVRRDGTAANELIGNALQAAWRP